MYLGALIGSYRVTRELGVGGMGVVYEGEHALLGRRVAIKVLLPQMSANQEIVRRFFNEAKAATRIADPGIIQVFDYGIHTDGAAFIVMELLDGDSLARRLETVGRFTPLDAVRLARQICMSLAAAHAQGIVHRDLKPENVFIVGDLAVTGGERTKVLDFGIAKLSTQADAWKTQTGTVIGTPLYMSPEQCRGAGVIDARSDVYQLGCLLMTMITGSPPFQAEGCGDLIVMHLREKPPLAASRVAGLPPAIDEILQRCLAKAPDQRYPSMHDLGDALLDAERAIVKAASTATIIPSLNITFTGPTRSDAISARATPTTLSGAAAQAIPGGTRTRAWRIAAVAAIVLVGVARFTSRSTSSAPIVVEAAPAPAALPFETPPMPTSTTTPSVEAAALVRQAQLDEHGDLLASAYRAYERAVAVATDASQRAAAAARAAALAPRLSHLVLAIPPERRVVGLALTCDGLPVGANLAVAIDGGDHEIVARAPGYDTWTSIVRVPIASTEVALEVPRLSSPTTGAATTSSASP